MEIGPTASNLYSKTHLVMARLSIGSLACFHPNCLDLLLYLFYLLLLITTFIVRNLRLEFGYFLEVLPMSQWKYVVGTEGVNKDKMVRYKISSFTGIVWQRKYKKWNISLQQHIHRSQNKSPIVSRCDLRDIENNKKAWTYITSQARGEVMGSRLGIWLAFSAPLCFGKYLKWIHYVNLSKNNFSVKPKGALIVLHIGEQSK